MKKENKKRRISSLLKIIPILYGIMFGIVMFLLLFFSWMPYCLKRTFLISNIFVLIPIIILTILFYKFHRDKNVDESKFKKILILLFVIITILQVIMVISIYFYVDWDVKVIRELVDKYIETGSIKDDFYLSVYPNNVLLTAILAFIKKIPLIGKDYITTLIFNSLLVNVSGILAALTIKNIKNSKAALISYIIMTPLILLSPWIVVPYSDTFALPCVTAIMYLYSRKKKLLDYGLIGLISYIGYKIKPTVIIVLIAIVIVEFISNITKINKSKIKEYALKVGVLLIGMILGLSTVKLSKIYLRFEPVSYAKPFTFVHYLAMGQNDETLGSYSQQDKDDTINYGKHFDLSKIKKRVLERNFKDTITFYSKKTLLNFNDGSFSWGVDGEFFYKKVKAPNKFAEFLREIYYEGGKYYNIFIQFEQYLWLIVLAFCPFIIKKDNNKNEMVIMLSIIGLVIFLTLFEPRTRYMYCFSEIFVMSAILGLHNFKDLILKFKNRKNN